MKKIPIKFRGKEILSGEYVYGDLVHMGPGFLIYPFFEDEAFAVQNDSVARLVGYDADGKEIYEGDTVFDADNNAVIAALYPNAHYKNYTLKRKW